MAAVPNYFLYGEHEESLGAEALHCETIAARSGRHRWVIRPHRHGAFFQLLCMTGGQGEALLGEERTVLRPPCAALVPAGEVHGFRFSRDVRGYVVTLAAERLVALLADAPDVLHALARGRIVALAGAGEAAAIFEQQIGALAREYDSRGTGRRALMEAHLLTALVWLHRIARPGAEIPAHDRAQQLARDFRMLVDANYRQHRPLAFYARRLGITPTHLNRIARTVLGDSALGVIHRRLLLEARRELTFSTRPVALVAGVLGFRDSAYFTRFFTRAEGMSPRVFRARRAAAGARAAELRRNAAAGRAAPDGP